MRLPLLVIVLCIALIPLALATPDYWTVVADDGKASDVVNAANFAASMKGSAAVTFTGKTDSQAKNEQHNPDGRLIVRFLGASASVIATDGIDPFVVDTAIAYLTEQEFSVSVANADDQQDDSPSTQGEESDQPRRDERPEPDLVPSTAPAIAPPGSVGGPAQDGTQELAGEGVDDQAGDANDEKPGVFSRLWAWLTGIFS